MQDKISQIEALLKAGKSTREIAKTLKVSLRDIGTVRKTLNIDFASRQRLDRELEESIKMKREIERELDEGIRSKEARERVLDERIAKRQEELTQVTPRYLIQQINLPPNYSDIKFRLHLMATKQLDWLIEQAHKELLNRYYSKLAGTHL